MTHEQYEIPITRGMLKELSEGDSVTLNIDNRTVILAPTFVVDEEDSNQIELNFNEGV